MIYPRVFQRDDGQASLLQLPFYRRFVKEGDTPAFPGQLFNYIDVVDLRQLPEIAGGQVPAFQKPVKDLPGAGTLFPQQKPLA